MLFIVQHFSDVSMAVFTCAKDLQQLLLLFSPPLHVLYIIYLVKTNGGFPTRIFLYVVKDDNLD